MFVFTPKNISLIAFIFLLGFLRQAQSFFYRNQVATIKQFIDETHLVAQSDFGEWKIGEILAVVSKNEMLGTIAFMEVVSVDYTPDGLFELTLVLQRQSRKYFISSGDFIKRLDLSTVNLNYTGATELLIHESSDNISSKYRPLAHQGFIIGDTAQTLYENEFLINYFGNIYYGFKSWLTFGTLAPINAFGRPNANFRAKLYDSESTTLSSGMSIVRLSKENEASLNLNFYWDSISSDSLISHTFLSLGLIDWTNSEDAAAIKYLTSSSFQTGYELILNNWDRFLIGPNYNFEKKALGGYVSYLWIMDRFHIQLSLNATDVTHLRLDPTDGYYGFFDVFWRF